MSSKDNDELIFIEQIVQFIQEEENYTSAAELSSDEDLTHQLSDLASPDHDEIKWLPTSRRFAGSSQLCKSVLSSSDNDTNDSGFVLLKKQECLPLPSTNNSVVFPSKNTNFLSDVGSCISDNEACNIDNLPCSSRNSECVKLKPCMYLGSSDLCKSGSDKGNQKSSKTRKKRRTKNNENDLIKYNMRQAKAKLPLRSLNKNIHKRGWRKYKTYGLPINHRSESENISVRDELKNHIPNELVQCSIMTEKPCPIKNVNVQELWRGVDRLLDAVTIQPTANMELVNEQGMVVTEDASSDCEIIYVEERNNVDRVYPSTKDDCGPASVELPLSKDCPVSDAIPPTAEIPPLVIDELMLTSDESPCDTDAEVEEDFACNSNTDGFLDTSVLDTSPWLPGKHGRQPPCNIDAPVSKRLVPLCVRVENYLRFSKKSSYVSVGGMQYLITCEQWRGILNCSG